MREIQPTTIGCRLVRLSAAWLDGHISILEVSRIRAGQIARAFGLPLPRWGYELVLPPNAFGLQTLSRKHNGWFCRIDWRTP